MIMLKLHFSTRIVFQERSLKTAFWIKLKILTPQFEIETFVELRSKAEALMRLILGIVFEIIYIYRKQQMQQQKSFH